jgi:phage-related protein
LLTANPKITIEHVDVVQEMIVAPPGFKQHKYWKFYRSGDNHVVRDFLKGLPAADYASVLSAMEEVSEFGMRYARKVRGEIYEVEADGDHGVAYRVLFAVDGHDGQMLLALYPFNKKTQKTPPGYIDTAEERLTRWRAGRTTDHGPQKLTRPRS